MEVPEEQKVLGYPKLSVAVVYSPDFSSVGMGDFSETGKRYGGVLSYGLTPRLSVRAGVLKIQNFYSTSGSNYDVVQGWFTNGIMPAKANGACEIVEIPVSVRFDLFKKNRHNVFISTGLSSYFMLNEQYEFEYGDPQPNSKPRWKSQEPTKYLFGVMNISAGYEYYLAPKWSLQAEPFINIPITGIGWGKVDLYSIGSYFTLKYVINRKY